MNSTADSDEELFKELEQDDDQLMYQMRERRMESLKKEYEQKKREEIHGKYGEYLTMKSEKELMLMTTATAKMLIHFAHKDFKRCQIMDKHLETLARKHKNTRFVKVDVEDVPFLVDRMEIKVLPCLVMFISGVGVDRLLGFEGVSEKDGFSTFMLEKRLAQSKVLDLDPIKGNILGFAAKSKESDDEWDE